MEVDNIQKILNKIIWMPYHTVWRRVFVFLIFIVVCEGLILFDDKNYPEYDNCSKKEGTIEKFGNDSNQIDHYISLRLQDGQKFFIPSPLREAYNWTYAFQELEPGAYVEFLILNEKDSFHGPRIMEICSAGQVYLTYQQSKEIYQNVETYNRKWIVTILAIFVLLLFYVSINLATQFWRIRKAGMIQYLLKEKKNSFINRTIFQIKNMIPFFFLLAGIICSGIAWHYHKDWKAQIDIPSEQQCMPVNGYVQNIEFQNNGETLGITLNNDATCYAEKKILGETYFSILSDVKEEDYVEFLIYSSKKETEPQIISYSNQNEIKITYQQGKDCYLLDATKEEKRIVLWYLCSAFLCMVVSVPILWMRKKEGANPNP